MIISFSEEKFLWQQLKHSAWNIELFLLLQCQTGPAFESMFPWYMTKGSFVCKWPWKSEQISNHSLEVCLAFWSLPKKRKWTIGALVFDRLKISTVFKHDYWNSGKFWKEVSKDWIIQKSRLPHSLARKLSKISDLCTKLTHKEMKFSTYAKQEFWPFSGSFLKIKKRIDGKKLKKAKFNANNYLLRLKNLLKNFVIFDPSQATWDNKLSYSVTHVQNMDSFRISLHLEQAS